MLRRTAALPEGATQISEEVDPPKDTEKEAYKIARCLSLAAENASKPFTSSFAENRNYARGENHWPTPTNQFHMTRDQWKAKTIRNRLYQALDQMASMVLDATPNVHAEPISDDVTTEQLEEAQKVVRAELKRLNWAELREDVFKEGAINGKAFAHIYTVRDKLADAMDVQAVEIRAELADSTRCHPDPTATRLSNCRYFRYNPNLDYSRALDSFEDARAKLKPQVGKPMATFGQDDAISQGRTVDEMINGPAGDMVIGKDGVVKACKVDVSMLWIRDDTIYEEAKYSWDQYGNQAKDSTDYSRAFPYGRLIATSGEYLLFDGENPYDLTDIFPFAEFSYDPWPDRFWGPGIVAMNKSSQMVADKTMAMALDAARKNMFGNLEVPAGADGYYSKGNAPDEIVVVPPELSGMAHVVKPDNVNMQLLSFIDETNRRDFGEQIGVSDVLTGAAPVTATSGKELEARARLASTRPGRRLKRMNAFDTDFANKLFQIMRKAYVGERDFTADGLNGELETIKSDVSMLPPGIFIRIEADPDEIENDALEGQNVQALVASGALFEPKMIPMMPILLPAYHIRPQKAKELQKKVVDMVLNGVIPCDPITYQYITGQPMPPVLMQQYQMQMLMAMGPPTEQVPEKKKPGGGK